MFTTIKKVSKFANVPTVAGSDVCVAENNIETGLVNISSIVNIAKTELGDTFVKPTTPPIEGQIAQFKNGSWTSVSGVTLTNTPAIFSGPIKKLFTNVNSYSTFIRALTKKNELIGWGENAMYQLEYDSSGISPLAPAYARFFDYDGTDYLQNNPSVTIQDLQWSDRHTVALLTDGTVWVQGMLNAFAGSGYIVRNQDTWSRGGFSRINFPNEVIVTAISLFAADREDIPTVAVVTSDNNAYMWGYNQYGQCGTDDTNPLFGVTKINHPDIVNKVAKISVAGARMDEDGANTAIITTEGKVWVTGTNKYGQLGTGDTTEIHTFTQPKIDNETVLDDVADFSSASFSRASNLFFIKTDGTLWGAGRNTFSQLGDNTTTDSYYFKQVGSMSNIIKMGCAGLYYISCIALGADGKVYTWGWNGEGQCGTGILSTKVSVPLTANETGATDIIAGNSRERTCMGFIKNNQLYTAGYRAWTKSVGSYPDNQPAFRPHFVRNVTDAIFIANDNYHGVAIFLTENGSVYGNGQTAGSIFGSDEGAYLNAIKIM